MARSKGQQVRLEPPGRRSEDAASVHWVHVLKTELLEQPFRTNLNQFEQHYGSLVQKLSQNVNCLDFGTGVVFMLVPLLFSF